MKNHLRNKRGIELSINMLVIISLAVFSLFLIIGFVLGGFSFFRDIFGGFTQRSPDEVAQVKCQTAYTNWKNAGSPDIVSGNRWGEQLCGDRWDVDFDNDGVSGTTTDTTGNIVQKDPTDTSYVCSTYVPIDCSQWQPTTTS